MRKRKVNRFLGTGGNTKCINTCIMFGVPKEEEREKGEKRVFE